MSTSRRAARVALFACTAIAAQAFATDDLPFGGSHTSKTYFGRGGDTGPYGPVQPKPKNPWTATVFGFRICRTEEEKCARIERQYQIVQAKHAVEMERLNWKKFNDCKSGNCSGCNVGGRNVDGNPNSRSVWSHHGKCGSCGGDCDGGGSCGKCGKPAWGLLAKGGKGDCGSCGDGCSTGSCGSTNAGGWQWADGGAAEGTCSTGGCATGGCKTAGCSSCSGGCATEGKQVGWFKSAGVCDSGNCGHFASWKNRGDSRKNQFYGDATRNYGQYPGMNREDATRYLEGMQYYPPYQTIRSPRDFFMFDVKYGVGQ